MDVMAKSIGYAISDLKDSYKKDKNLEALGQSKNRDQIINNAEFPDIGKAFREYASRKTRTAEAQAKIATARGEFMTRNNATL